MDQERYKKVDEIFDAALEVEPEEREAFLQTACGSDAELRREVESLLNARNEVGDFIQTPAVEEAVRSLMDHHPPSLIGRSIKHYRILSLAGTGGMGEVYIAEDTQLHRKVALKILPSQFTTDPDRIARFQRESRTASALNHPNIITIHEIGQSEQVHFIVTEYIEGDTLRKKVTRGKLSLKEAIEIIQQVASALTAAHAAGIVHRDIKPENIMIRRDGYVKVLDFGLAKLTEKKKADDDHHLSTETGMVMGTVSYMSPEQASGQEVDHRTDIFSLGVVLYEALTGKNPFRREHFAATLKAVIEEQPESVATSDAAISFELDRIITRLLEKEKDFRYQTAADMRAALRRLQRSVDSGITASVNKISTTQPIASRDSVSRWWRNAAMALALISVFLFIAWFFFPRGARKAVPDWQAARVEKVTDHAGAEYFPSLSPDGKSIIYASDAMGNFDIYLQRIGTKKTINLTEDSRDYDSQAAFSPDGTRIAFRSERNGGGIFVMNETGESVRQLTNFGYNPAWSPDGKEIACAENEVNSTARTKVPSRMWVVNVATGESRVVSAGDAVQPNWSPNGKRISYWTYDRTKFDIWTMRLDGSDPMPVTQDEFANYNAVWSPDGNYLYFISSRNGVASLWRVAIDESSGRKLSEPELIPTPSPDVRHITFSKDGKRMALIQSHASQNAYRLAFHPDQYKVTGQPEPITRSTSSVSSPAISPDGDQLVYLVNGRAFRSFPFKQGATIPNRLMDDEYNQGTPRWSPDGKRITFHSFLSGAGQIYMINPDGSGQQQITQAIAPGVVYPVWSPDGARLAYSVFSGKSFIMDSSRPYAQQTPEETPFFPNSEAYFIAWDWSPDGKYLAGTKGENGVETTGIYTYSLATKSYEEITDLFSRPLWLRDSRHLIFSMREKIFVSDTQTKKTQEIFSVGQSFITVYSISKDNRYIYASIATPESDIWLLTLE